MFWEMTGDEKNALQNKLFLSQSSLLTPEHPSTQSLDSFKIKNHRICIYSWLNSSSLEKTAIWNSWLHCFIKIFPPWLFRAQAFLSVVGLYFKHHILQFPCHYSKACMFYYFWKWSNIFWSGLWRWENQTVSLFSKVTVIMCPVTVNCC